MFINAPTSILTGAPAHGSFFPGPYSSDPTGGGLGPMKGGKRKSRINRIKRIKRRSGGKSRRGKRSDRKRRSCRK